MPPYQVLQIETQVSRNGEVHALGTALGRPVVSAPAHNLKLGAVNTPYGHRAESFKRTGQGEP